MILGLKILAQIIVSLGLLNVWLIRFNRPTAYRGGNARSMKEEFAVYGLPPFLVYLVGGLKVSAALLLLVGIWLSWVVTPAAVLVSALMTGAFFMHLKVGDPFLKAVPALSVLALSLLIIVL